MDVVELMPGTKPARIVPAGVALGRIKHLMETGQIPGMENVSFFGRHYTDNVHMAAPGRYLTALVFFSSFYKMSPEGNVISAGSTLTPQQATIYQQVAWDVVKNYAWGQVYTTGTAPCAAPAFSPDSGTYGQTQRVTISSATPGSWFRYTVDGSTPTPTHGLLYMAPISVRPGSVLKAVAFQSGMAPSPVTTGTFAVGPGQETIVHEPFAMPATGLAGYSAQNAGFTSKWEVAGANATYSTSGSNGLSYTGSSTLVTSGGLLTGGTGSIGRGFNLTAETPWVSYLKDSTINPRDRELWFSCLLRKDAASTGVVGLYLVRETNTNVYRTATPAFSMGYFGTNSETSGTRFWSIRPGTGSYVKSAVPITLGQPALLVGRVHKQSGTNTLTLYVNPTRLGGTLPAMPSVSGTLSNPDFTAIAFQLNSTAGGAADEFRIGESYASVTPAPPEVAGSISFSATTSRVDLAWGPAYAASAYNVKRGTAVGGPFTTVATSVTGTSFTDTTVGNGVTYYYVVSGTNAHGSGPESPVSQGATPQTGFTYWRESAGFTSQEIQEGKADPAATPAGDGVSNLMKYALGIPNPKVPSTTGLPSVARVDATTIAYSFRRERSDITYTVETSGTLGGWVPYSVNPGAVGGVVTVQVPSLPGDPSKFVRLKITQN